MTAKLELRENFKLDGKWVDRLTNHEAESVLSQMKVTAEAYDASHGEGDFKKNHTLCKRATFESTLKVLTHRGVPMEKRQ